MELRNNEIYKCGSTGVTNFSQIVVLYSPCAHFLTGLEPDLSSKVTNYYLDKRRKMSLTPDIEEWSILDQIRTQKNGR